MIEQGKDVVGPSFAAELVEAASDALIALSVEGKVLWWNRGAEVVFGYTREEALGRPMEDLVAPSDAREEARCQAKEILLDGPRTSETVRQRKDGSHINVDFSRRLVTGKDGLPSFVAVVARDVTALTRLRQERAIEARDSARVQESDQLRSEFLANMSHELRTPLNTIIGFTELMFKGKVGPVADDHREYLGDIRDSSRHLLRLINDVLDLARLESGNITFRPEPLELAKVVAEVRDILRGPASAKRIRVETELDPTLPTVSLDPAKFKLMFYGYLSHALKVTPDEGHVTVRVAPEGPDWFHLEVEDTGDPGQHEDIELSRRIVEAQGGRVTVRTDLGKGTVLSVVLPTSTARLATSG